jgi:hypothetical protein
MIPLQKTWFLLGISAFSIMFGGLIGVSQTPVVGVFITGILGFIVGLSGNIFRKSDNKEKEGKTFDFVTIGKSLFFLSIFLVLGVFIGSQYRSNLYKEENKEFVWTGEPIPFSMYEAFDWIMVQEILSRKGYSGDQINELYKMRMDTLNYSKGSSADNYYKENPYYKILQEEGDSKDLKLPIPTL